MSTDFVLHATKRAEQGKGASRRLRHAGKFPAIVYGAGKEPVPITLDHNEALRHLEEETFY
ncbi:MAG: 50S ribosomal protein L25, partial [Thiothrix sp.]